MLNTLITSNTKRLLIKHLFISKKTDSNYALALSKHLGVSYMPVQKELQTLERQGVLVSRQVGKTVLYEANKAYPFYKELKALVKKSVRLEKTSSKIPDNVTKSLAILKERLDDDSNIFIFGSRAQKNHKPSSDWDIGFTQKRPLELYEFLLLKKEIRESAWPLKVDVVDFSRVTDDFKALAMKNVLYIKKV